MRFIWYVLGNFWISIVKSDPFWNSKWKLLYFCWFIEDCVLTFRFKAWNQICNLRLPWNKLKPCTTKEPPSMLLIRACIILLPPTMGTTVQVHIVTFHSGRLR